MDIAKNKILQPGFEVKMSSLIYKLSKKDWGAMKSVSTILMELGEKVFNAI